MNTENLKTFILLSKLKNFTLTAQQQFIAQSTVTNRIFELEKELGKQLFIRERKNVRLTPDGINFLDYAQRILDLENTAKEQLNTSNKFSHSLRIGSTNTIYDCHLQNYVPSFMKKHKDIAVKITMGHSQPLIQMLSDNVADIAFTYIPYKKKPFICLPFKNDEMVLVTRSDNIKHKNGILKNELKDTDYLYCNFPFQDLGNYIRDLFPTSYYFPFETDKSANLLKYLEEGFGYSFLPISLVQEHLKEKRLIKIPLLDFNIPWINSFLIVNKNKAESTPVHEFISEMQL